MKQVPKNNRRQRSGRRQGGGGGGGHNLNRVYDSAGPEGKVRGTAQQIIEKYSTLARDAMTSGDRIVAENFFQHAEHYQRIVAAAAAAEAEAQERRAQHQAAQQQQQQNNATTSPAAPQNGRKDPEETVNEAEVAATPNSNGHDPLAGDPRPEPASAEQSEAEPDDGLSRTLSRSAPEVAAEVTEPAAEEAPAPKKRGRPRKKVVAEEETPATSE